MKYILTVICIYFISSSCFAKTFSTATFTIDYKNWFKTKFPGFEVMFLIPKNTTATYHENISVVIVNHPYKSIKNWMAIKAGHLKSLRKIVPDLKLKQYEVIQFSGHKGIKVVYTGSYMQFRLTWIQYNTLVNGKWYVVSYIGSGKDFKEYHAEAVKIIKTFKIK